MTVKEFLLERNSWREFCINYYTLRIYYKLGPESVNISGAFVWSDTPEGYTFWERLDTEYRSLTELNRKG